VWLGEAVDRPLDPRDEGSSVDASVSTPMLLRPGRCNARAQVASRAMSHTAPQERARASGSSMSRSDRAVLHRARIEGDLAVRQVAIVHEHEVGLAFAGDLRDRRACAITRPARRPRAAGGHPRGRRADAQAVRAQGRMIAGALCTAPPDVMSLADFEVRRQRVDLPRWSHARDHASRSRPEACPRAPGVLQSVFP